MSLTVTLDLTDAQIAILEKVATEQNTTVDALVKNDSPVQIIRNRAMRAASELINSDSIPAEVLAKITG